MNKDNQINKTDNQDESIDQNINQGSENDGLHTSNEQHAGTVLSSQPGDIEDKKSEEEEEESNRKPLPIELPTLETYEGAEPLEEATGADNLKLNDSLATQPKVESNVVGTNTLDSNIVDPTSTDIDKTKPKQKKKDKKPLTKQKIIFLTLASLLVLFTTVFAVTKVIQSNNEKPNLQDELFPEVGDFSDAEQAKRAIQEELRKRNQESNFNMRYSTAMTGKVGSNKIQCMIENSARNDKDCYIELLYGSSVIYKSKMMKPGKAITEVEIDREFSEGIYDISVKYHVSKDKKEVGMIEGELRLNVTKPDTD